MTAAAAALNITLGLIYMQFGTMTLLEMRRAWGTLGFSHFGAAWVAMAFTCGPHHFFHGIHLGFEGRVAGPADLIAVLVGFPAGLTWFLLRVEAFRGGSGDRFVPDDSSWLLLIPFLAGSYVTALVVGVAGAPIDLGNALLALPNGTLLVLYLLIAYYLTRTQLANRPALGGWSLSGVSLSVVFLTCALMHAVFGFYTLTGRYGFDVHGGVIDLASIPAAIYFIWVVRGLHRGSFADWNVEEPPPAQPQLVPSAV